MADAIDRPAARRVLIALVALLLIVGVVAAINHQESGPPGDARLRTDGIASLTRSGLPPKTVSGTVTLLAGDVVEAVKGTITIDLPDGAQLEGRAGTGDAEGTKVRIAASGQPGELMVGELLVTAERGVDVEAGGNHVRLEPGADGPAAARMSRSLAVAAGVYRGTVTVDSAGQRRSVPALRAIDVAVVGRPPAEATPIKLSSEDPWDRRYLGAAIDLGLLLDKLSDGYTRTLRRTDARTVGFYRSLLPALAAEDAFTQALVPPTRDQGEVLVGGAIAALGRKAPFAERWENVFDFRDDGAGWGLIALDQGVSQDPLLADLDKAVNGTGFEFAQPAGSRSGGTPTTAPPATTPPQGGQSGPGTTRAPTTSPPPTSSPTPTTQPLLPPPTAPVPVPTIPTPTVPPTGAPPVDDLVDTVNQVVGGLLGQPAPP